MLLKNESSSNQKFDFLRETKSIEKEDSEVHSLLIIEDLEREDRAV